MGGALEEDGVFADETVTFSVAKPVHLLPPTEQACGILTVVDIGVDSPSTRSCCRLDHDDVAALWPVPAPERRQVLARRVGVVAGSEAYTGPPCWPSPPRRVGAGMVRYVGTPTPTALVHAAVPEAVHGPGRVQAWVVGPGLDVESTGAAGARPARRGPICPGRRRAGGRGCRRPGPARRRRAAGTEQAGRPCSPPTRGSAPASSPD